MTSIDHSGGHEDEGARAGKVKVPLRQESLGDGFVLRSIRDEEDVERFIALNEAVAGEGPLCHRLIRHHPGTSYDNYFLVEDERTGQVVSTTCLVPWLCCYEDAVLKTAMLEMVVTHPDYRHRGLVRAQVGRFHRMIDGQGFDLSVIQGIPYYYRQYGYTYAIDQWSYDSLAAWKIPDRQESQESPYRLQQASVADVPALTKLYQDSTAALQLRTLRSADYWRYLLEWARYPARLVRDRRSGETVGYICTRTHENGQGIRVIEDGVMSYDVAMAVLHQLKMETAGEIRLNWPQASPLVQIGRSLGGVPVPAYQWLVRITDVQRFLSRIAPVLERRLVASGCAGLTFELRINLFRQALALHFEAGRLLNVESVGFVDASTGTDGGDLCIPPDAFVRLALGYRALDELRDAWPDIVVQPGSRHVLQVLFPKLTSDLCMPY
jgi:predicted N-acetyltransferase YhbS